MKAQDSCKSQGKEDWKVTRGSYNMEEQTRVEDLTMIIVVQPEEYGGIQNQIEYQTRQRTEPD